MHRGYVKLFRRLKDSDFWKSEKFSRPQAWVDLLMLANHKDTFFRVRGQRIDVKRGQIAFSEVSLSERWKWSRGKVRRFLEELESDYEQKIEQQKSNLTTLITIKNYKLYQGNGTADETIDRTTDRTTDGTHLKNVKNEKKENIKEFACAPLSIPTKDTIEASSIPKIEQDIIAVSEMLYRDGIFSKAHAFANLMLKQQKNPRAVLHTLTRCYTKGKMTKFDNNEGAPWAYCMKIVKVENGNFNERDHSKDSGKPQN